MTLKQKLLTALAATLLPLTISAQSISQSQIEQFKNMPRAQQEALARQYGVDLDTIRGGGSQQQRPDNVNVVEPLSSISDEEREQARQRDEQEREEEEERKNGGLKPFGYELFEGTSTTFAPVTEIPVPVNYTLGPGDVLRVQLWGKENQQLELPISRDGTISFPDSGPVSVAGLSFDEARQQIKKRVSEQYIGVEASVSLGELRSMRVFVLGEARKPGSYSVSSLSTITNALYVSGGIKKTGSLRQVQHKRDGKVIGTLDLYDLLLKGDTSADRRLQPGDAIFIPPVGPRVGIDGEVYRPALYELDGETSLQQLVRLAGGMTPQAYPQRVKIERTNDEFLRIVAEANLTTPQGQQARVKPGDRIDVASIADITGQYVEIKGAATRPGRYAWIPGMRASSLIQSIQNDLEPAADTTSALIVRVDEDTDRISTLAVNLRKVASLPGSEHDPVLQERDRLYIFSDLDKTDLDERKLKHEEHKLAVERLEERNKRQQNQQNLSEQEKVRLEEEKWLAILEREALTEEEEQKLLNLRQWQREPMLAGVIQRLKSQATPRYPAQVVEVNGEVRYPGEYPLPLSHDLTAVITLAGGLKDSASMLTAELARIEEGDRGDARTTIQQIDLAAIVAGQQRINLQSRDTLLIKPIPDFDKKFRVTLEGEVRFPGEYTFGEGETLSDVLERAGGLTDNAFPRGAVFTRKKLRELEAERLREAEERLQGDLLGVQLQGDSFGGQNANRVQQVQGLLEDVQNSRPLGRMVIDLEAVVSNENYQAIRLQDGDALTVPTMPQSVTVLGEVQYPTSHLHSNGVTVDDYLERSGGPTRQADETRVYVVKADGSVMLPKESRWWGGRSQTLQPGDTIIVPIDVDRLNQLELWSNVSQIIYQMALGAAAVGNL